ncbi:MAG TPA: PEP-CTERM sorting domain-containing protein [Telluria sp.]|nr:PEP-CTERM sorting domain-containing protein [Telluria sp.]
MTLTLTQRFAIAGATLALCGHAAAADVAGQISYRNLGLANSENMADASAQASDSHIVGLDSTAFPSRAPYPGYRHYVNLTAAANDSGALQSVANLRAGGLGVATSEWHDTIVNRNGHSQNYAFHFALSQGQLELGGWSADHSTRDYRAAFSAEVLVNGVSVWRTERGLSQDASGFHRSASGADIGAGSYANTGSIGTYTLDSYNGTLNLGQLNAGQALDVRYVLTSRSYWNDPDGCAFECGGVSASVADPLGVDGNRITAAVPEPESCAMLLGGLALLGFAARRKRA